MRTIAAAALILASSIAAAAPLYTATATDGSRITLTDERGPCEGQALLAAWMSKDGQRQVRGCWTLVGEVVWVAFLDGDIARVPTAVLRKAVVL